ncbi:MAG TPA: serine/threonine-protein kinase, partial [Polyangiaceae bacterium]|nr:serine/threonine-protein kinase [Polyangiaceae bacterium]
MLPSPLPPTSRYELLLRLAAGGTATVYVGRLRGAAGFSRLVAIKRAHHHLIEDPSFRGALLREARIASQLRHPNVVSVVDVEEADGELLLIMDYVEGASLAALVAQGGVDPIVRAKASLRVLLDACAGLDAAHRAIDERGRPFGLVHRDVSPQNILVGVDGVARVIDFGIAKVSNLRSGHTGLSLLKGKVPYMAPEYLRGEVLDSRSDVFGAGVVLWEALTGRRLFRAPNEFDTLKRILELEAPPVSSFVPGLPPELDRAVARALAKARDERYDSAREFGDALEAAARGAGLLATHVEVGELVTTRAGEAIQKVRKALRSFAGPFADEESDGSSLLIEVESAPGEGGAPGGAEDRATLTASPVLAPVPPEATGRPASLSSTTGEIARALNLRGPGRARTIASGALVFGVVSVLAFAASVGRSNASRAARLKPAAGAPGAAVAEAAPTLAELPPPPPAGDDP